MKRSESVLVYAVTAVLAVILVVAVVFGNEGEAKSRDGADGTSRRNDLGAALGGDRGSGAVVDGGSVQPGGGARTAGAGGRNFVDPARELQAGEGVAPTPSGDDPQAGGAQPPFAGGAQPQYDGPIGPLRSDARVTSLATALGPFRAENQVDGTRYRVVEVQRGDTFSDLVLRWTNDPGAAARVLALNEWINPNSLALRAGDEVFFPWVDDAELLSAWQSRRETRRPTLPQAEPIPVGLGARPAPATVGESYEVKKGETLWVIAERKVGRRAATSYIDAIVAANASIADANSVRAGQRILLPAIQ